MDPLSITTSILTLIGAASKTYGVLQFMTHADEDPTSLCVEVCGLEGFLSAVQAALKRCGGNPLSLASIDQDLWRRIDMTLSDCRETLDELSQLAQRICIRSSALVPGLLHRAMVAKRLQEHAKDIASYRDRIRVSNWNLQTLLQVMDVSLSLANRDSHAKISSQLDLLNQRVQERVKISLCLSRSNSPAEHRFLHNMEDYILAIRTFHEAASFTAGSMEGHSGHGQRSRELTDQYGSPAVVHSALDNTQAFAPVLSPTTALHNGYSKMANKAIQDLDFLGAETFLRRAMEHHRNAGVDSVQHRRLRKQLCLSLFFQGRDREAKDLVLDLAEHYEEGCNTTCQLLFALALSLAHELEFDEARTICKQLCQLQYISEDVNSGCPSQNDIFKLLVTCYRQSGDWMSAEAIKAEVSDIDEDLCISSPLEFILGSNALLLEFLGDGECRTTLSIFIGQVQSLPVAKRVTRLQERFDGASIFTARSTTSENGGDQEGDALLRLESRHLRSAAQLVRARPKEKNAPLRATYARLSSSLKHLAHKSRLHSSFQLLQWQRCTHEAEKLMRVHYLLSWIEGQVADHGTTSATDRLYDYAEYSPAMSGFNDLPPPISELDSLDWTELDSIEIRPTAATQPQREPPAQARASITPLRAPSPMSFTHADIPVVDSATVDTRAGSSLDLPLLSRSNSTRYVLPSPISQDGYNDNGMATSSLSLNIAYPSPYNMKQGQTECDELSDPARDTTDPCVQTPHADGWLLGEGPRAHLFELPGTTLSPDSRNGSELSLFAPTSVESRNDSTSSLDHPRSIEIPKRWEGVWTPDRPRSHAFSRFKAAVVKRVKRPHRDDECPVCSQEFKNRPDNVKPHVIRRHPERVASLYPKPT